MSAKIGQRKKFPKEMIKMCILKSEKLLLLAGGAVVALLGKKVLKSQVIRKICVEGMATGMKLQKEALETFQNMKEEAEDLCHDSDVNE